MKKTRICDLLGIEYPIIQGGMAWVSNPELAAAVSNAGALGMISVFAELQPGASITEHLRNQIKKTRSLTDKPFGLNVSLITQSPEDQLNVAIEEGVTVITTVAGNPATHTKRLKEAGITVLHVVLAVSHAKRAEEQGVDAVIASGYEAGGALGRDEMTTFALVPQVVSTVRIPVVAAGGIADARGFIAALVLGAEGVQMGTRFIATRECTVHEAYKKAIVSAKDTDTAPTGRKIGALRVLKNEIARKALEMESAGASAEELLAFFTPGLLRMAAVDGNIRDGSVSFGQISGMITEIVSAEEVVRSIVEGSAAVLAELQERLGFD